MPPKLGAENKLLADIMTKKFDDLKNDFDAMKSEFLELLTSKNVEIENLGNQVLTLKKKVSHLENTLDEEDAYIRRDAVILSGTALPDVSAGEICSNIVCDILKDKLHINVRGNDISVAHRLGKKPTTQGPDKRNIIVKLCRSELKREILTGKRNNFGNPTATLFINESLTPRRRTILYALRQMKRAHPSIVVGCSSMDGRIFAFTKPAASASSNSPPRNLRHLINTHENLVEFCRHYIKVPLDAFLDSWTH